MSENPTRGRFGSLTRSRAQVLLLGVTGLGAVAGAGLMALLRPPEWGGLLLMLALAAVLERQGTQLFTQTRASVSAAAIMGGGILYGVGAAVPLAIVVGLAAWLLRHKPVSRLAYNSSVLVLAGAAAAGAYRALTGVLPESAVSLVISAVGAGLAMWLVNMLLVGAMISFTTGQALGKVVRDNYLWLAVHFAVMGLVALGLALSWRELGPLGFAAFTAPVGVLALALRQGADKAKGAMLDAASANALIRDYERLLAEVEASSEDVAEFISAKRAQLAA
jgi:hypothetical protein